MKARTLCSTVLLLWAAISASAQTLTVEDYLEIRNVIGYYNLGYDSTARADGGAIVASAFTPDMLFTRDTGQAWRSPKEIADQAVRAKGPQHWDSNLIITPDAEGARTFNYSVVLQVEPAGSPAAWRNGGSTRMLLVKTPQGWRIKGRYNYTGEPGKKTDFPTFDGRPLAAQSPVKPATPSLSPADYIEIEMLYGWNNIALDNAAEKGEMFARTFTADGSFAVGGQTITGRKALAEFASSNPPGLRHWLSNLYIEPSAGGAIGWAYVATIDGLAESDPPGTRLSLRRGELYRDVLVKTSEGWRFKSRVSTPGTGVPPALPLPAVR